MKRKIVIAFIFMVLLGTSFTTQINDVLEKKYKELQENLSQLESAEEKLDIIKGFLNDYPASQYTENLLYLALHIYADQLGQPANALEFVNNHLAKIEDSGLKAELHTVLISAYGKAGKRKELESLVSKLESETDLTVRDRQIIAGAALQCNNAKIALQQCEIIMQEISPEYFVKIYNREQFGNLVYRNTASLTLTQKAEAFLNLDKPEEAITAIREAANIKPANFIGISSNNYYYYSGLARRRMGDLTGAIDDFSIEGLIGGHNESMQALRESFATLQGSDDGFAQFLTDKRKELSRPAPDFTLKYYYGGELSLSSLKGKVVFLNFWSPTCAPCIVELPLLKPIWEKYHDKGFEIIALTQYQRNLAIKFIKEKELPFHFLEDTQGYDNVDMGLYKCVGHPTSYIIGRDGKVYFYHLGFEKGDEIELEREILLLLGD